MEEGASTGGDGSPGGLVVGWMSQHEGDLMELAGVSTGGASRGVHWWSWQGCPLVELAGVSTGGAGRGVH